MARGRDLTPSERALWRRVARTARPLPGARNRAPEAPDAPGVTQGGKTGGEKGGEREGGTAVEGGVKQKVWAGGNSAPGRGDLRPAPAPADRSAERKLRRGNIEIEARADLHGLTQDQARAALGRFLHSAKARGLRSVLVITGKGGRPADRARDVFESEPGILRRRLPHWLAEPDLRAIVSGYSAAHRRHGGEGAFYVLLKAR